MLTFLPKSKNKTNILSKNSDATMKIQNLTCHFKCAIHKIFSAQSKKFVLEFTQM
jgi:hypothetical protein